MSDAFYPGQTDYLHKLSQMWDMFEDAIENGTGPQGWSPSLAIVADGDRRVMQLVDWIGGEGTKPTLTGYLGTTGIVADIEDAVDLKGATGSPGTGPIVGEIKMWSGLTNPPLHLICDGSAISRTTYNELYMIMGVTYGTGDGTTTFNLPDLRQAIPIGIGTYAGGMAEAGYRNSLNVGTNEKPSYGALSTTIPSGAQPALVGINFIIYTGI